MQRRFRRTDKGSQLLKEYEEAHSRRSRHIILAGFESFGPKYMLSATFGLRVDFEGILRLPNWPASSQRLCLLRPTL